MLRQYACYYVDVAISRRIMAKINEKKYKNAILFFANRIRNGTLGKLKLMKLLYFLDFDFFEKYGRSVTGDEYLRF